MSNGSDTIKFNNKSKNRDYNIFLEEYFGGSDVFIYVNGKRVHNISHIQFAVQERQKPIYGYGSRTFDDIAIGDRIVIGAMKIPVTNTQSSIVVKSTQSSTQQNAIQRKAMPSWVDNYNTSQQSQAKTSRATSNIDDVTISIQKYLNIEQTGELDFNTKVAISKFREKNDLNPGCYIDNELLSLCDIDVLNVFAKGEIKIYSEPQKSTNIKTIPPGSKLTVIASDDNILFVRDVFGTSGYIEKGDVEFK